jgi:hypothetical protein
MDMSTQHIRLMEQRAHQLAHERGFPAPVERDGRGRPGDRREVAPWAELLIDCEEDRTLRAVLVRMLREAERGR